METPISLLLPTRGRPELAQRFLDSVVQTVACLTQVEVIIYVDEDDVASHQIAHDLVPNQLIIGPRKTMGLYNSECFEKSRGEIIVLVNDDMVIRSSGWDQRLREMHHATDDQIYLAYGNDLFKKNNLCTFPILSRKTCQLLQKPYHPIYRGAFIDYHLMDIFKRVDHAGYQRIRYLDDVIFEHLHYRTGKAVMDDTYKSRGRFDDDMLFISLAPLRAVSASILIDQLNHCSPAVPRVLPDSREIEKPKHVWTAIWMFSRVFLADRMLPLQWRFFLWWWFIARYIASRIL